MVIVYGLLYDSICLDFIIPDISYRSDFYINTYFMQEIITWIVIIAALVFLSLNLVRGLRLFKKSDPCKGCGNICDNCPVYMKRNE
jgi:hypothetical protein